MLRILSLELLIVMFMTGLCLIGSSAVNQCQLIG